MINKKDLMALMAQQLNKVAPITETTFSDDSEKIIIPKNMDKKTASEELMRQYESEEEEVDVSQSYDWDWQDTLHAIKKVSENTFGWIQGKTIHSFFGSSRPTYIQICTDIKDGKKVYEECFYGNSVISSWEDADMSISINRAGKVGINLTCKKRYKTRVLKFLKSVDEFIKENSIYLNKAIMVKSHRNYGIELEILEVKTNPNIVLNQISAKTINNYIINELTQPKKRTYLFTGAYGNGKSETAMNIAEKALEKGLTFFYVENTDYVKNAIDVALKYSTPEKGVLVFAEDIDQKASGSQRDAEMNSFLNQIDGVTAKGRNIKTILTTNHANKISQALRRPGRIDIVVAFDNPSRSESIQIIKNFCGSALRDIDWDTLDIVDNVSASVIAEACKRANTYKSHTKGIISHDDLQVALTSMVRQAQYMAEDLEEDNSLETAVSRIFSPVISPIIDKLEHIEESM
jgi:AAA+ superfamily predicted ATPase